VQGVIKHIGSKKCMVLVAIIALVTFARFLFATYEWDIPGVKLPHNIVSEARMRTIPVGSGMPGQGSSAVKAYCFNSDLPGHAVRILGNKVGGLFQVTKVNIASLNHTESVAVGIIASKASASTCVVVLSGLLTGVYSGLDYGIPLFIGDDSYLYNVPPIRPISGTKMIQFIASAMASDTILVRSCTPTRIIAV